uniref:Zinc finger CCCH domain-containing protein 11-like n=1 Tax=Tanacetum cinerariifolium TaxID=118510 RepID=A0A6L2MTQ1_TANCI|nr:zinc finger CCCH domain-containing protein 11-like [Tanacetum cinerariifolium]
MSSSRFIKHDGSVRDYYDAFVSFATKVGWNGLYGVSTFILVLEIELARMVSMFNPKTLYDAYCLAILQESTNNLLRKRCSNMLDVNSVDITNIGINDGYLCKEDGKGNQIELSEVIDECCDVNVNGKKIVSDGLTTRDTNSVEKGDEKSDRKHDETGDGKSDEFVHFDGKRKDLELLDENREGFELLKNRLLDFVKLVEAACDDKLDEVIVGSNDLESNELSEVEVNWVVIVYKFVHNDGNSGDIKGIWKWFKGEKAESVEKYLSGIQMDACGKMESEKVLNKIKPLFCVLQHVKESMRKIRINGLHTEIGATRGMKRILDTIKENHMASDQPLAGKFVKDRGKKNGSKSDVIEVNEKEAVKASQKAERAKDDSMSGYELFLADARLFVDDVEAYENYPKGEKLINSKQEAQESSSISGSSTYKSKAPGVVYIDEFDSVER